MTFEQLIVLDAVVSQGTFRGAADYLNKSQSAISHMIKNLEQEIGVTLLSRQEYRPRLTTSGEVFYRHSTRTLRQMTDLKSVAQRLNSEQEPEVTLAVTATYPLPPLLHLIGHLTTQYPATHIRLTRDNMGGPIERLLQDEADIVVTTLEGVPSEQVEAIPLSAITITPVAHPDFEPARTPHLKTVSEMQSYVQVVVADNSTAHKQSRGLLPVGLRWTVSDFATKKEIILAKMGWGGLPEHHIQDELNNGALVRLNVEGFPPAQTLHYVMRRRNHKIGTVAQEIWESLCDCQE